MRGKKNNLPNLPASGNPSPASARIASQPGVSPAGLSVPVRRSGGSRASYRRQHPSQLSWVLQLKAEQLAELQAWLEDGRVTYLIATQRLQERFNFKISKSALCRWYVRQLPPPAAPVTFVTLLDVTVELHGTPLRIQVSTPITEGQP